MSTLQFETVHAYDARPTLRVILITNDRLAETFALVDSGAQYSAFDVQLAEELMIEVEGPPYQQIVGIEARPFRAVRRSLYIAVYADQTQLRTTAFSVLFLPRIGLIDNVIGRDLLEHLPFALLHGRRELHLGLRE